MKLLVIIPFKVLLLSSRFGSQCVTGEADVSDQRDAQIMEPAGWSPPPGRFVVVMMRGVLAAPRHAGFGETSL